MSDRIFSCSCQKCGAEFEFTGSYEKFNDFMSSKSFTCRGGHTENHSPRAFLKILSMSEPPRPTFEWKPTEGRNYVNILDHQTVRISGMQIDHLGSGVYMDRRTRKKYDYEEDTKGDRHYYEVQTWSTRLDATWTTWPEQKWILANWNIYWETTLKPNINYLSIILKLRAECHLTQTEILA